MASFYPVTTFRGLTPPADVTSDLPRRADQAPPRRLRAEIVYLIVHHTGVASGGTLAGHAGFHTRDRIKFPAGHRYAGEWMGRGWPILAYHGYIDAGGQSLLTNHYEEVGYHCRGYNRRAIGIVIEGDFSTKPPSPEQLLATAEQIVWHEARLGRRLELIWHDETRAPEPYNCPGAAFPRAELIELVDSYYAATTTEEPTEAIDPTDNGRYYPDADYTPFISPEAAQDPLAVDPRSPVLSGADFLRRQARRWRNNFRFE